MVTGYGASRHGGHAPQTMKTRAFPQEAPGQARKDAAVPVIRDRILREQLQARKAKVALIPLCFVAALLFFTGTPSLCPWLPIGPGASRAYAESYNALEKPEPLEGARSIYVGDIINLDIAAGGVSMEDLREKFKDFEIVELKEKPGGYQAAIRTFAPGEYIVRLGDKEIVIQVGSTLEDIHRGDLFEGGAQVIGPGPSFHWRILFCAAGGVFALSCAWVLSRLILRKKSKTWEPYQLFLRCAGSLAVEDGDYFVELTRYFKEYIESLYQCKIIGKTSSEIMDELKGIPSFDRALPDIGAWLAECDRLKFTGVEVANEKKQEHCRVLLSLVERVEWHKADTQNEGAHQADVPNADAQDLGAQNKDLRNSGEPSEDTQNADAQNEGAA